MIKQENLQKILGNLDYSGTQNGKRIMGLASLNKNSCSLELDPVLNWPIPENWSLEDAATAPYAYTSVCICLQNWCNSY